MHRYTVVSIGINGQEKREVIDAINPGQAMSRANGRPVKCFREGRYRDGYGYTEWQCPSLAKVTPLPSEHYDQLMLPL